MKLKITTLVIVEEGQVQDIYHSLNDDQDKAYQEIINQVNAEYGDGGVLQFYSLQGIKDYFEIDYYLNFLEEPETLYTFTENIISLFKSFIK